MAIDCLSAPGENSEINQNYIKSPEVMQPSSSLKLSFKLNLMIVSKSIDLVARSCCNCCIFIVISALILTTTIAASDVLKGALMQPQDGWGHGIIASSVQIMPRRDHGSVARLWSEQSVRHFPEQEVHFLPPGRCSMASSVNKYFGNDWSMIKFVAAIII